MEEFSAKTCSSILVIDHMGKAVWIRRTINNSLFLLFRSLRFVKIIKVNKSYVLYKIQ